MTQPCNICENPAKNGVDIKSSKGTTHFRIYCTRCTSIILKGFGPRAAVIEVYK